MTTLLDAALHYAALGWPVMPLHDVSAGVCSCNKADCRQPGKHPRTLNGVNDATTDEYRIRNWWGSKPAANIGIAVGQHAGVIAIDFDQKDGGIETSLQLGDRFPDADPLVQKSGGGGLHWFFRYPEGRAVGNRVRVPGLGGLDVRGNGGYVLVYPSMHASGGQYVWLDSDELPTMDQIPEAPAGLIDLIANRDFSEVIATMGGAVLTPGERRKIASALESVRAVRGDWLSVGMALHEATGGSREGFDIWQAWSEEEPAYAGANVHDHFNRWKSFKPRTNSVTLATLYGLAKANGWIYEGDASDESVHFDAAGIQALGIAKEQRQFYRPLVPFDPSEFKGGIPERKWLLEKVIPQGTPTTFFGAGGTGKSHLMQKLALCVATGSSWYGIPVAKGVAMMFASEDDKNELARRHFAICRSMEIPETEPIDGMILYPVESAAGLVEFDSRDRATLTKRGYELLQHVRHERPTLVVIDNIGRTLIGDENKRRHAVAYVEMIAAEITALGGTAIIIGHDNRNGSEAGSAGWRDAFRAMMRIEREKGMDELSISLAKANYSRPGEFARFKYDEASATFVRVGTELVQDDRIPHGCAVLQACLAHSICVGAPGSGTQLGRMCDELPAPVKQQLKLTGGGAWLNDAMRDAIKAGIVCKVFICKNKAGKDRPTLAPVGLFQFGDLHCSTGQKRKGDSGDGVPVFEVLSEPMRAPVQLSGTY